MNTREFITKIIRQTSQNQIMQRVKSLPKILSIGVISTLGLIPLTSISTRGMTAYAAQQLQLQTNDPWYQSLEMAQAKVQAALSPGAFGHGVPGLYNMTASDILLACGISVLGGVVAYLVVRELLKYRNKRNIYRLSMTNKII
ncbi:hypothetical protein [Candidatus Nitrosocosmicus sp. SS]|jgi:undecaprenyl pyrophosphate phosphatase UppP|uniref:hypothetical protein n=1 Tax=Candidatus Nitrosocosmicus agrestis TaxID=2563600 RepID=UPI00122E0BDD|nr:hypothetical protein [Candidatus Nitrosocosmicus sp. SS]KAA2283714.1 hypothetical protein F1Z66_00015 [Candidatus Nitrosocosmicus sp. SS]KAF0867559.1 hypothetical protein E5N71_14670 [Candidatus Nitrosocosmicus sp. SS]